MRSNEIKEVHIKNQMGESILNAYILPNNQKWPSFYCGKQRRASCNSIYFQRVDTVNITRFNETVRLLKDDNYVITIGCSGIGKSTELNSLLMVFLKHIGEDGWPTSVMFRYDINIIHFKIENSQPVVLYVDCPSMVDVQRYTFQYPKAVIIIELKEGEADEPQSRCARHTYLSCRNSFSTTNETYKSEAGYYFLMQPHSLEQLQEIAAFEYTEARDSCIFSDKNSVEEVKDEVNKRVSKVGPIIRSVISKHYEYYVQSMKDNASKIFKDIEELAVDFLPSNSKLYIAPYVTNIYNSYLKGPPNEDRSRKYEFRFNSYFACQEIAKHVTAENFQKLREKEFDYLVAEDVMRYGLMSSTDINDRFSFYQWKFYANNPDAKISKKIDAPHIQLCDRAILYPGVVLQEDVSNLKEKVLYHSCKHNAYLFDALTVSHKDKMVYMFQSSYLKGNEHNLSVSTIRTVLRGLCMWDDSTHSWISDYKVCFVYCSNENSKGEKGCVITTNSDGGTVEQDKVDIKTIVEPYFKIVIARVVYYPQLPEVMINIPRVNKKSEKETSADTKSKKETSAEEKSEKIASADVKSQNKPSAEKNKKRTTSKKKI